MKQNGQTKEILKAKKKFNEETTTNYAIDFVSVEKTKLHVIAIVGMYLLTLVFLRISFYNQSNARKEKKTIFSVVFIYF